MHVWVKHGSQQSLLNPACKCSVVLDHILHLYSGDEILKSNDDVHWPDILQQYDVADEYGYLLGLNKNLLEDASNLLTDREIYVLIRITVNEDGKSLYTPLLDEEDGENTFTVKEGVRQRPPAGKTTKKPSAQETKPQRKKERDSVAGMTTSESKVEGSTGKASRSGRRKLPE